VLQPSKLGTGTDFHCFKAGIEPKWEDPKCTNGGKWTASPPRGTVGKGALDIFWLHTLLAMIGEQFDEGDEICGAVVSVRARQDKISIWTKTASNEAAQVSIGKQWKDILDFNEKIGYLVHVRRVFFTLFCLDRCFEPFENF
jgi:translation initiation factor 4E